MRDPGVAIALAITVCVTGARGANVSVHTTDNEITLVRAEGTICLEIIRSNIVRVEVRGGSRTSARTLVVDPGLEADLSTRIVTSRNGDTVGVRSNHISASISRASSQITFSDDGGKEFLAEGDAIRDGSRRELRLIHAALENLYGMSGVGMRENDGSLLRQNGAEIAAGAQGEGGAPFFFTTHYGVLVDSDGGMFDTQDGLVRFSGGSREDLEYFVIAGSPFDVMTGLATLTGRPPLPPKWTLGFINSQWGADETEIKEIASSYRVRHIPMDAFTLDFDWKAWGEDNYGEWRWNSSTTAESFSPNKFSDGESGKLARELREQGIRLTGILKPRVIVYGRKDDKRMHIAAEYAQEHNLWYPDEPLITDYFTGRPTRDVDFSKAVARSWYWKHLEPSFDAGMIGWWNDEADHTVLPNGRTLIFNNVQFMNMGRALYEGQRGHSDLRVWSLNRNYYLGAQRYGYAEWSGDIQTGFQSMDHQRVRMLATLNLGEPHWSMDGGGFVGRPSPENYARWIEFAAFIPICRVHGDLGQKRQPWVYGERAEAAVTRALRLRYELLPYIYSYERVATETGIGVVRPLFWKFPDDPQLVNDSSAWMFGDALLVAPVVTSGRSSEDIYLPRGEWYDYFRGTRIKGGRVISYKVDANTWQDIPLFIRSGSIIASQAVQDFVGQDPVSEVTLDVFPGSKAGEFVYYDDDGETYAYERGVYYRQPIRVDLQSRGVSITIEKASGSFDSALRFYTLKIHGVIAGKVELNGHRVSRRASTAIDGENSIESWETSHDRFGTLLTIEIPARGESTLVVGRRDVRRPSTK